MNDKEGVDVVGKLPTEIKLTRHAKQRLEERKNPNDYYNTKNLMKSSCKWYGKDDLIQNSQLYIHCLYVCRKAKNKMSYITDGNIEVLYDKKAKVAITIMEVKEKFLPITQYIKPEILEQNKRKKNIVYREKTTKPMTISELFGTDKKVYEEAISIVKN